MSQIVLIYLDGILIHEFDAGVDMDLTMIFEKKKPIIGALHLLPLFNQESFEEPEKVLETAMYDLGELEAGGVDSIIVENNYDLPHSMRMNTERLVLMTYICSKLKDRTELPIGLSVLWNDYRAALSIAKAIGGSFVRIPVFVDSVITDFGRVEAEPEKVVAFRKKIGAENVAIFVDVQVKHSKMVVNRSIGKSLKDAETRKSDAVIVTGRWTGKPPPLKKLKNARSSTVLPIVIGSGMTKGNVKEFLNLADAAIVGTEFKEGKNYSMERNVKPYTARVDRKKVGAFMNEVDEVRDSS